MRPRRVLGLLGVVLLAAVAANVGAGRARLSVDLTAERSATLSAETRRVVGELDRRVRATAFFAPTDAGRVEAATLLARYRRVNPRISWRILDPTRTPGEAQRLGALGRGSASLETLDGERRIEVAQYVIEIDVTSALARLMRDVSGTVCFTSGHAELSADAGLGQAVAVLRSNGYEVRTVDLLASPEVPEDCAAVVVAAPATPLSEAAVGAVRGYLDRYGKAIVLADPAASDLNPVVQPWGITIQAGTVVEGDPGAHLAGDPTAPIVSRYAEASAAVRGLGPIFLPGTLGLEVAPSDDPALTVYPVAQTSPASYLERGEFDSGFDPSADGAGPVAVGAVVDDSSVQGDEILRTRLLVWGDVDFLTDAFIGEASNARLWIQSMDWLTQPEDLVTAVPNFPKIRELELTAARSRYVLFVSAGVVPGLFLLAAGFVWVIRRGR